MDSNSQALYAIREVSELTGVKPVTLRAWQRRYHLIQPQRTEKGHRLYSQSDIDKVKEIQSWLAKGVSIGRVMALLNNDSIEAEINTELEPQLEACSVLHQALADLNRGRAESIIATTLKEYPLDIVEAQFITPVLEFLTSIKAPQRTLQRALFQSILITRLAFLIESENKASAKGKMLCVSLDPVGSMYAWLWATKKAEQGFHVTLLDGVDDVSGLVEHIGLENFKSVEVFANKVLTDPQRRALDKLLGLHQSLTFAGVIPLLNDVNLSS